MASSTAARATGEQRREQRDRRRFARRQWAGRWMRWRVVVAVLVLLTLVGTAVWLVLFSAVLSVSKVTVEGNRLLGPDRVLAVADVPQGQPLALVDLEAIARRVAVLAEVEDVDVTRAWPDGVRIDLTERTAIAVVELGGTLRGLDAEGVVFREYRTAPRGLPRVRPTTSTGSDALAEAAGVVAVLPPELAVRVDHVEVQTIDQITLVLRDGREVLWGSAEQSELKARVLPELLAAQQAGVYDVSVPESPLTRPR